jgi:hypothetical protein
MTGNSLTKFAVAMMAAGAACASQAYVIALPDAPTPQERSAAADLQDAFRRMGLGEVPVVDESHAGGAALYVGATRCAAAATNAAGVAAWRPDEIFLKSVPGGVVMTGDPMRGVIYAAETYLEDFCGVRWWTSTESSYPRRADLPLSDISRRHASPFVYRETYYLDALDADFKVRLKQNFASRTSVMNAPQHDIPAERGGSFRFPIFKNRLSAYHTFFVFVPPADHFKAHPEWFSLVKGKREPMQLCLTNKEMEDEFVASLKRTLRGDPGANFVQVSQMDQGGWCECAECAKRVKMYGGEQSGLMIDFVNRVAARIEPEFPQVTLDTFAYQYTRRPPKNIVVRSNVVVRLCTNGCAYNLPLDEHPSNKQFLSDLEGWAKVAPGRLFAWDYVTDFMSYVHPHPNWRAMPANIRIFAKSGAVGAFLQGDIVCSAGEFVPLRLWLQAHLLWDPSADDRALMAEFLDGYYGKAAAPHLKDYIDLMSAAVASPSIRMTMYHEFSPWIKPETVRTAEAVMGRALAAARGEGAEFERRVRRESLSLEHLVLADWDRLGVGGADARQARVVAWIRNIKEFGVKQLREFAGLRFNDYLRKMLFSGLVVAHEDEILDGAGNAFRTNDDLGLTKLVRTNDYVRIEMAGGRRGRPGVRFSTPCALEAGDWLRFSARQTSRYGNLPFHVKCGGRTLRGDTYMLVRFPPGEKWAQTFVKVPAAVPEGGEVSVYMERPLWEWTMELKSIERISFADPSLAALVE